MQSVGAGPASIVLAGSPSPGESRWRAAVRTAFPFLVVGAIWEVVARLQVFPPRLFPPLEVVAAALTDALGARDVSFLIADYSGRALIRLSHVRRANPDDEDVNRERSHSVTLAGTPHGRALAEQEVQIVPDFGGFRVFAPVTSRGEAVGVLELGVDDEPDRQTLATVTAGAHALAYIVIANTDSFPRRTRARAASSRWPDGWRHQVTSVETRSTSVSNETRSTSR